MMLSYSPQNLPGWWLLAWPLLSLMPLGMAGCANRDVAVALPITSAPLLSPAGEAPVPDRWWTTFDDPNLDREIAVALDGSFTLAGAWQRLRAAQALTRREASDLWPDLFGVGEAGGSFRTDGDDQFRFALGLDAAYQVDLWGEIGSRVEAERLRSSATLADYFATALTLSAEVARTWYSLIEAQAQLELLNEQIETNLTGVELQEARFGLGQIRSPDVLRQRQLVESTREQAVVVQSRIELLEHRLAVLQGRAPQGVGYETGTVLPDLPPLPDTGLPSELLNRRPDVRRDYLALWAADRDLASAIAAQYPRLDLAASLTTAAESPENLFRDWLGSIASGLIAPLFLGGELRAEVDRNVALVRERFTEYGETVLVAYREVEDALALERYQRERLEYLNSQLELARQASTQLREQYLIGDTDYLNVLNSITDEQRLQRTTLSARLDLVLTRISLYLALAGDFDPRSTDFLDVGLLELNDVGETQPSDSSSAELIAPPEPLGDE